VTHGGESRSPNHGIDQVGQISPEPYHSNSLLLALPRKQETQQREYVLGQGSCQRPGTVGRLKDLSVAAEYELGGLDEVSLLVAPGTKLACVLTGNPIAQGE